MLLDSACYWLPPSLIAAWTICSAVGLTIIAIIAKQSGLQIRDLGHSTLQATVALSVLAL